MLINLDEVSLSDLEAIYRGESVELDDEWRPAVERSARIVARAASGDIAFYGVNTGFGKLATVQIPARDVKRLQRNLVLSHCAGIGNPLPGNVVRLVMALKLFSLARGMSGVRWEVLELLAGMIRHEVLPLIPEKGSVGASGDLAPLAHLASVMIGEGASFPRRKGDAGGRGIGRGWTGAGLLCCQGRVGSP